MKVFSQPYIEPLGYKAGRVMPMAAKAICFALLLSLSSCDVESIKPGSSVLTGGVIPQAQLVPCRVESQEFRSYLTTIHEHINFFRSANGKSELPLNEVLSASMMQSAADAEKFASLDSSDFANKHATYLQENNCTVNQTWVPDFELPAYVEAGSNESSINRLLGRNTVDYWTTDQTPFTAQYTQIILRDTIVSIGVGVSFDRQNSGRAYVKVIGVSQGQ